MGTTHAGRAVSRIWLYSNQAMVVKVVERRLDDNAWFVEADGPADLRGQHRFTGAAESAAFLGGVDRQLSASGFACLWRSEERRSAPARPEAPASPAENAWFGVSTLRALWTARVGRSRRPRVGLLSEDWLAAHGSRS